MKRRNFFLSLLALIPGLAMRWKLEPVKPVERICKADIDRIIEESCAKIRQPAFDDKPEYFAFCYRYSPRA